MGQVEPREEALPVRAGVENHPVEAGDEALPQAPRGPHPPEWGRGGPRPGPGPGGLLGVVPKAGGLPAPDHQAAAPRPHLPFQVDRAPHGGQDLQEGEGR